MDLRSKKTEYEDIRQVSLKFLDEKPQSTLKDLHNHIRQFIQLKNTSNVISEITHNSEVNKIQKFNKPNTNTQTRLPPRPCRFCNQNHTKIARHLLRTNKEVLKDHHITHNDTEVMNHVTHIKHIILDTITNDIVNPRTCIRNLYKYTNS